MSGFPGYEFEFSEANSNLCQQSGISSLPWRYGKFEHIATDASHKFLVEWRQALGKAAEGVTFYGCSSGLGHLVPLNYPECIPERVVLTARCSDFALYWDGEWLAIMIVSKWADDGKI